MGVSPGPGPERWDMQTITISFTFLGFLLAVKIWKTIFPRKHGNTWKWSILNYMGDLSPLIVVILSTVWARALIVNHGNTSIKIVGQLPVGLPSATVSFVPTGTEFITQLPAAIAIVIVGYLESIAVDTLMARKFNYRIDRTQELNAIGATNLAVSDFLVSYL